MTDPENPAAPTGPQEGRCGAIRGRDADGKPNRWCRKYPMRDQLRCERDGGKAPQNLAAAARRQAEAAALTIVARYGVPADVEWHQAMQEALNQAYGDMLALRDLVQRLEPEALTWGTDSVVTVGASRFPGIDSTKAARVAPLVELYERSLDRLFRMGNDCGKLGLEAQRTAIGERQGAQLAQGLQQLLPVFAAEFGWDDRKTRRARELFAEMLRSLAGGPLQVTA